MFKLYWIDFLVYEKINNNIFIFKELMFDMSIILDLKWDNLYLQHWLY